MALLGVGVSINGRLTIMRVEDRCLHTTQAAPEDRTWGEEVTVDIHVRFGQATRTDGICDAPPRDRWWEASVTTSFSIDDFVAGPIAIPIDPEPIVGSTPLPDNALEVVITGFVR